MRRWLITTFSLLVLCWHLVILTRLGERNRELEAALSLGHRQVDTIERQTDALQEQTQALNECTLALHRLSRHR
jgi:hypothetical protein